jgi:hypothetical protein
MEHTNSAQLALEWLEVGENFKKERTFYSGVTDHVYFEGTRSPPVGTADIAFVSLFARMRFGGPLVKRG